jgi:ABC-type nickel/cobalt efflux system permease component RcnA
MHVQAARALTLAVGLLVVALAAPAAAQAPGTPWAVPGQGTPAAPPPATPGAAIGGEGGPVPGFLRPAVEWIAARQRALNRTMSRELRAVREGGASTALAAISTIAFLYGVLHAAGPGHGKLVVSSFFLAREARVGTGILVATAISFLQAATSVVLVSLLAVALGQQGFDVLGRSVWLEALSYALVVAIGLVIAGSGIRHHHHDHESGHRVGLGMIIAAGLTPCASALIIMLFALTHGVLLVGIGATLVMATGMSITVSLVGILTILGRRTVMLAIPGGARRRGAVSAALTVAGGVSIAIVGGLLFAGAWWRLG